LETGLAFGRSHTLAIYTHSMRRTHDDCVDKIAILAGLAPPVVEVGNIRETNDSVESQEAAVSDCFIGSHGRIIRGLRPLTKSPITSG